MTKRSDCNAFAVCVLVSIAKAVVKFLEVVR